MVSKSRESDEFIADRIMKSHIRACLILTLFATSCSASRKTVSVIAAPSGDAIEGAIVLYTAERRVSIFTLFEPTLVQTDASGSAKLIGRADRRGVAVDVYHPEYFPTRVHDISMKSIYLYPRFSDIGGKRIANDVRMANRFFISNASGSFCRREWDALCLPTEESNLLATLRRWMSAAASE
jgi:hypothetical protein